MQTMFERVRTEDGFELHGLLYVPEKEAKKVVLHCHGMAGNFYENRFVDVVGRSLVSEGVAFCAMNNRGHDFIADILKEEKGKISYERVGQMYERIEDCVKDIHAWVGLLKKKGFSQIVLMGHSLGAVKAVLYASENERELVGLALVSPPDMIGLIRKENYNEKYAEAKALAARGKERELLRSVVFDNYPISAGSFLNFFGKNAKTDIFSVFSKRKPAELQKLKCARRVIYGEDDDCYSYNPKEIEEFFKKNVKGEFVVIKGANHGYHRKESALADEIGEFVLGL